MQPSGAAHPQRQLLFAAGDYVAGGLTGAATAATPRAAVSLDMVLAGARRETLELAP